MYGMVAAEYTGRGDPARTMALLWRTREESARGRAGLSVDRIVAAAIEVADTDGIAALSMRRVADRLGVGAMSLYTYVPGKAELLDVMVDTVYGEVEHPEIDGGWRRRLEQVARANWALFQRHPWLLQVSTTRPVLGPNLMAEYEYELNAVDGLGLTAVEMDSIATLVVGYAHGAARLSLDLAQAEPHTGMSDEQWWSAHGPHLETVFDVRRYPTAAVVGQIAAEHYGSAYDSNHYFDFGLQRILDGISALVKERSVKGATPGLITDLKNV